MKELAGVTARAAQYRLEKLIPDIKHSYQQAKLAAVQFVQYAVHCGNKLNEAKLLLPHGSFERWVLETADCNPSTARRYMRVASHFPDFKEQVMDGAGDHYSPTMADVEEWIRKQKKPKRLPDSEQAVRENVHPCTISPQLGEVNDAPQRKSANPGPSPRAVEPEPGADETGDSGGGDCCPHAGEASPTQRAGEGLFQRINHHIDLCQGLLDQLHESKPHEQLWCTTSSHLDLLVKDLGKWERYEP